MVAHPPAHPAQRRAHDGLRVARHALQGLAALGSLVFGVRGQGYFTTPGAARPASMPSRLRSSSTSGQWMPCPSEQFPMLALRGRRSHEPRIPATGVPRVRPSDSSTINGRPRSAPGGSEAPPQRLQCSFQPLHQFRPVLPHQVRGSVPNSPGEKPARLGETQGRGGRSSPASRRRWTWTCAGSRAIARCTKYRPGTARTAPIVGISRGSRTSTKRPAMAAAAAMAGDTRWVRPLWPCRPSKLRFEVEAQRSSGASRSAFMARHMEQPGSRHSKPGLPGRCGRGPRPRPASSRARARHDPGLDGRVHASGRPRPGRRRAGPRCGCWCRSR